VINWWESENSEILITFYYLLLHAMHFNISIDIEISPVHFVIESIGNLTNRCNTVGLNEGNKSPPLSLFTLLFYDSALETWAAQRFNQNGKIIERNL
jgi:hypothetical protein